VSEVLRPFVTFLSCLIAIASYSANEPIRGERISKSGRNGRICGGTLNISSVGINSTRNQPEGRRIRKAPAALLVFEKRAAKKGAAIGRQTVRPANHLAAGPTTWERAA
jgi:hypothetical protein